MSASTQIICKQCRKETSLDNVRYAKNGRDLICLACHKRSPREDSKKKSKNKREKFICLSCNYKFSLKANSRIERKCPYCESSNITPRDEVTADSVLSEVSSHTPFLKR